MPDYCPGSEDHTHEGEMSLSGRWHCFHCSAEYYADFAYGEG